jgi:uncharacterized protein YajQ (UPF0234 family)
MASECSFDIVSKVDLQEVDNAVQQTMKEVRTRYDFKGSVSEVTRKRKRIDDPLGRSFRLRSVLEILNQRLAKRGVPLKALKLGEPRESSGGTVTQILTLQEGIGTDQAREIVKIIKGLKTKAQPPSWATSSASRPRAATSCRV